MHFWLTLVTTATPVPTAGQTNSTGGDGWGDVGSTVLNLLLGFFAGLVSGYLASRIHATHESNELKRILLNTLERELSVLPERSVIRWESGEIIMQTPFVISSIDELLRTGVLDTEKTWDGYLVQELILMRSYLLIYNEVARTVNSEITAPGFENDSLLNWTGIAQRRYDDFLVYMKNVQKIIPEVRKKPKDQSASI
ncbi:MAG: hypothetical protein QOF33_4187 [Thermomicrobiales bacterium]|jgi:hypothetical protein|nr:hypothetical protein [Thermomicrobiales bacterium]